MDRVAAVSVLGNREFPVTWINLTHRVADSFERLQSSSTDLLPQSFASVILRNFFSQLNCVHAFSLQPSAHKEIVCADNNNKSYYRWQVNL